MESHRAYMDLAEWIRQVFQSGFQLDRAGLAEMEASFGISTPSELCADDLSSEAASFLDLLFFPDHAIRLSFETRWGDQTFTRNTVEALLETLQFRPVMAMLPVAGQNAPIELRVPGDAVSAFVHRLNIAWQAPDALRQALETRLPPRHRATVRTWLRQAPLTWHANQVAMVDLFLEKFVTACDDFEACLVFLLGIIATLEPVADLFGFLIAKKLFYFQSLCRAEAFERRRQSANMETLILQGERAAHGNIAEWRQLMQQVDRICQQLFGQTRFFQQPLARRVAMDSIFDFLD